MTDPTTPNPEPVLTAEEQRQRMVTALLYPGRPDAPYSEAQAHQWVDELILAALSPVQPVPSGLDAIRERDAETDGALIGYDAAEADRRVLLAAVDQLAYSLTDMTAAYHQERRHEGVWRRCQHPRCQNARLVMEGRLAASTAPVADSASWEGLDGDRYELWDRDTGNIVGTAATLNDLVSMAVGIGAANPDEPEFLSAVDLRETPRPLRAALQSEDRTPAQTEEPG